MKLMWCADVNIELYWRETILMSDPGIVVDASRGCESFDEDEVFLFWKERVRGWKLEQAAR